MEILIWLHAYHGGLFDSMRLIIIGFAIDLTFIGLIGPQNNLLHS